MVSLQTIPAPSCLEALAQIQPLPSFSKKPVSPAVTDCMRVTRPLLLTNQGFQCVYCERPILDDGGSTHIEHLEAQNENGGNPNRRFDITNLAACCQTNDTCGHQKGPQLLPVELNPYQAIALHERLRCSSEGTLYAENLPEHAANFAFQNLNLNSPALESLRTVIITSLQQQTIAQGAGNRNRLRNLSTTKTGFKSLYYQVLGRFGFPAP